MWSRRICAALFPALLLLPALHLHPAATHAHGAHDAHYHAAVTHADFLLLLTHDHGEQQGEQDESDDTSTHPSTQIGFSTLLPRHLTLFPPAFEQILGVLSVKPPVLSLPSTTHAWLLARDHAPPAQTVLFSPSAPRSPPRCV